jgi:hypothetical protein
MTHWRFNFLIPPWKPTGKIALRLLRSFAANGTMREFWRKANQFEIDGTGDVFDEQCQR